jgi:hypothetical protein
MKGQCVKSYVIHFDLYKIGKIALGKWEGRFLMCSISGIMEKDTDVRREI